MSLSLWTIYKDPTDFPGKFVARRFELDQPTRDVVIGDTLEEVRGKLPRGLYRLPRSEGDEPQIVETWL